jgi:hypothetical protein
LGGHLLIAKDFEGPNKEDEEMQEALSAQQKSRVLFLERCLKTLKITPSFKKDDDAENPTTNPVEEKKDARNGGRMDSPLPILEVRTDQIETTSSQHPGKRVSFNPLVRTNTIARDTTEKSQTSISRAASTYAGHDAMSPTTTMVATAQDFNSKNVTEVNDQDEDDWSRSSRTPKSLLTRVLNAVRSLLNPATISIAISIPIALIRPVKALFVPIDDSPIPHAPDGYPPLYFILDTANFLGAASVPIGLVCLGTALAKMKLPKKWTALPLGAIGSLAIGKLIISPILGVLIVNGFVKTGFIHEDDKILRFVAMFFSCMPTATTQVIPFHPWVLAGSYTYFTGALHSDLQWYGRSVGAVGISHPTICIDVCLHNYVNSIQFTLAVLTMGYFLGFGRVNAVMASDRCPLSTHMITLE